MSWIQTHTGADLDLLDPKPGQIRIEDVAWSLGRICRFSGHTKKFYSVAEHSVLVAQHALTIRNLTPKQRMFVFMAGLLHDAHETYTGDMTSPMKIAMGSQLQGFRDEYRKLVRRINKILVNTLVSNFLPRTDSKGETGSCDAIIALMEGASENVIAEADLALLNTERAQLLGPPPRRWIELPAPALVVIEGWDPEEASARWRTHFDTALMALKEGF